MGSFKAMSRGGKKATCFPGGAIAIALLLLCLGYALAFILPIGWPSFTVQNASKDWPSANAVVVHAELLESGIGVNDKTYQANIHVRYSVAGQEYQLFEIYYGQSSTWSNSNAEPYRQTQRYAKGRKVTVYYNPERPTQAFLETGVQSITYIVLGIAAFIAFLGLWLSIYTVRDCVRWLGEKLSSSSQ